MRLRIVCDVDATMRRNIVKSHDTYEARMENHTRRLAIFAILSDTLRVITSVTYPPRAREMDRGGYRREPISENIVTREFRESGVVK